MLAQLDEVFIKLSKKKTYTRLISYILYEGRPVTTKGRWINPVVFSFLKIQSIIPCTKSLEKPIFILGTGRSGTTILGKTLGIHKDVGFLNEPKAVWSYAYPFEDIIGNYNNNPAKYMLNENDMTSATISKLHRIYCRYLKFSLSSRVVDKYPELIFRHSFVKKAFPDAKFIFLYRNGWDTCASINQWSERLGTKEGDITHDWWGVNDIKWNYLCDQVLVNDPHLRPHYDKIKAISDHKLRAAVEWILTMQEGINLTEKFPDEVIALKYEDFVSSKVARNGLLDFLELPPDDNFNILCDSVLAAVPEREPFELPLEIKNRFTELMRALDYKM